MPLLGVLLKGIASTFGVFFAVNASRRVLMTGLFIAAMTALTVAFLGAAQVLISALVVTFPEEGSVIETMVWVATPVQVTAGISGALAFDVTIGLYRWNAANFRRVYVGAETI